jgi:GNAT superfamily N-acetyltransferase
MSATEFIIERFDPKAIPDETWDLYFQFSEAIHNETNPDPDDPPLARKQSRIFIETLDPIEEHLRWAVWNESKDRIIGTCSTRFSTQLDPGYEKNRDIAFFRLYVADGFRRQGIATALIREAVQEAVLRGVTILQTFATHETGTSFLEAIGGQMAIASAENWLKFANVDWEMMEQWKSEGPERAPGVQIESFTEVPESDLEYYCKLYTEINMQQPLGDLEGDFVTSPKSRRAQEERFKSMGLEWLTLVTRELDGTISGLTEILRVPSENYRVHQMLTGVHESYRGKGLGKWLKALMILHVKENYPAVEVFSTGNADSNAPMLSINNRMGFKRYLSEKSYKFDVASLKTRLDV